jgi:predicted DNA-binding WGR domain protein
MAFLTRTDPTRNINRFYVVDITPTLFAEWRDEDTYRASQLGRGLQRLP